MSELPLLLELPPNRVRRNYRGGLLLDKMEGRIKPADSDRPEDWIASVVPARNPGLPPVEFEGLSSVSFSGEAVWLYELINRQRSHFLGSHRGDGGDIGFLVKLLDSGMRLHTQAHPTAEFARRYLGSRWGKLEAYIVLASRNSQGGYIRLGFQHTNGPGEWRRIVLEQDINAMDACFEKVPVSVGDVWIVPGGLPHAIGPGLLMIEVMEPSDLVVRCEFEREGVMVPAEARFMGVDPDLALRVFDYTEYSVEEITRRCRVTPERVFESSNWTKERLIGSAQTGCFEVLSYHIRRKSMIHTDDAIHIGIVVDGNGTIATARKRISACRGTRFLVPAAAHSIQFLPDDNQSMHVILCRPR